MEWDFKELLMLNGGYEQSYNRGDTIYSSASGVEGVYFLTVGKIRIDSSRVRSKKEVLMWLLTAGNFFGISSYYNGYRTCEYVTTVVSEQAQVVIISREKFILLLTKYTRVRDYIIGLLYRRLDYLNRRRNYTARVSCAKKVVDALIFSCPGHEFSVTEENSGFVRINISLLELASMINATRKQVIPIINDLIAKRILERDAEGFTIWNCEKLMSYAA